MNSRYLVVTLVLFVIVGLAITSRSTLTPLHGVDHVFYGGYSDFLTQEAATGDFDGDGVDDIVTTIMWDDPATCGAAEQPVSETFACDNGWKYWNATKSGEPNKKICRVPNEVLSGAQYDYWVECGWALTVPDPDVCDDCVEAQWFSENKGAAYIFAGGDWSGKGRDIDLATGSGADHMVVGYAGGDKMYNGIAVGDVTVDAYDCDELVLGASQHHRTSTSYGPGEVYVIGGNTPAEPWPAQGTSTITPPDDDLVDHYFKGRDENDAFGLGVAVGDLDGDGDAEVVVAAPLGDGPSNNLANSGEIYIFYSNASLPDEVDLSTMTDSDFDAPSGDAAAYAQLIWGAAAGDETGVTLLQELHQGHSHPPGNYEPTGLAIGDWNGDGFNDLAIGAGAANGGDGAAYVIFGAPTTDATRKLQPGKTLRLYRALGHPTAPDVKITGKDGSRLGAGIAIVDADGEGLTGDDDLVLGAPYADLGGDSGDFEYYGECYITWGASSPPDDSLYVGNSSHVDVTIHGQDLDDQIGGHFAGNFDVDHDGINDLGIAGQDVSFLLFGREQSEWESTIDLESDLSLNQGFRVLKWTSDPAPSSMTIEFLDLDGDDNHDLVFGGYDNPGFLGEPATTHGGQMWVTQGWDMWKKGTVAANATWSGIVFVDGDITVASTATLTIAAGTHVWIWQNDAEEGGVNDERIEINVEGELIADGTAANPIIFESWDWETQTNEDWVGFYFDSGSDGGTFDNCIIRRAEYGIESYVDLTVSNTDFEDCRYAGIVAQDGTALVYGCVLTDPGTWGIFLTSADATVRNTVVDNATSAAIHVQSTATLALRGSVLRNSDKGMYAGTSYVTIDSSCVVTSNNIGVHCYGTSPSILRSAVTYNAVDGVLCDNAGSPDIQYCQVSNNYIGVYCSGTTATPVLRHNTFANNTGGVYADTGADPDLGVGASGNNTFSTSNSYYVANTNAWTVGAEYNYWSKATAPCLPNPSKIIGPVDSNPALCSNPNPVSAAPGPATVAATPIGIVSTSPNPFNPSVIIKYGVPGAGSRVQMNIYDVQGKLVRELVNGQVPGGLHDVVWDGTNAHGDPVASSIYFLRMSAGSLVNTRKLVLLK